MKLFEVFGVFDIKDDKANKAMDNMESKGKKLAKSVGGFVKGVGKFAVGTAAVATGVGTAMMGAVSKTAEAMDEIDKMSQKVGMTAEAYQEWDFVMKKFGGSMEGAVGDMAMLSEKMMDAQAGMGEGAELFSQLGINVEDSSGKLKSQEVVFGELIEKLRGMEDITKRNAIASAMLGGTGEDLIPILNQEASEIDALKEKAHELGVIQSNESVEAGAEFSAMLKETTEMLKSMGMGIGITLMPMMTKMLKWVQKNLPEIRSKFSGLFDKYLRPTIGFVVNLFKNQLIPAFATFSNWVSTNMPIIRDIIVDVFQNKIMPVFNAIVGYLQENVIPIFLSLYETFEEIWPEIVDMFKKAFENIYPLLEGFAEILIKYVIPTILLFVKEVVNRIPVIWEIVKPILNKVINLLGVFSDFIMENVVPIIKWLLEQFQKFIPPILDVVVGVVEGAMEWFGKLIDGITNVIDNIKKAIDWINIFNDEELENKDAKIETDDGDYDVGDPESRDPRDYVDFVEQQRMMYEKPVGADTELNKSKGGPFAMKDRKIEVNIINAKAFNTRDVDKMGEAIVGSLRRKGLSPNG